MRGHLLALPQQIRILHGRQWLIARYELDVLPQLLGRVHAQVGGCHSRNSERVPDRHPNVRLADPRLGLPRAPAPGLLVRPAKHLHRHHTGLMLPRHRQHRLLEIVRVTVRIVDRHQDHVHFSALKKWQKPPRQIVARKPHKPTLARLLLLQQPGKYPVRIPRLLHVPLPQVVEIQNIHPVRPQCLE